MSGDRVRRGQDRRPAPRARPSPSSAQAPAAAVLELQGLAGNRAVSRLCGPVRRLQRFAETEHKLIGDTAWGSAEGFELAPGFEISFGDAVALGDYFGSYDSFQRLAAKPGKGIDTRGEVLFVLWNKIWHADRSAEDKERLEKEKLGKWYDKFAKHNAEQRELTLRNVNISHFPNPLEGDTGRTRQEVDKRKDASGAPLGGGATYRKLHEEAIAKAWEAGTHYFGSFGRPADLDEALLRDAFACHFLSDAFSASHINTPRTAIKEYWNRKVPGFDRKLVKWLSQRIPGHFSSFDRGAAYGFQNLILGFFAFIPPVRGLVEQAPGSSVETAAREQLSLKMGGVGFGDLISLVVHDYSGHWGVKAQVAGKPIKLVGDSGILDKAAGAKRTQDATLADVTAKGRATFDAATDAVKASIIEVQDAYVASQTSKGDLRSYLASLTKADGLYAGERSIPTTSQKELFWKRDSVDALLADERMNRALVAWGESRGKEMEEQLISMPEKVRKAVRKILIEPLRSRDEDTVRAVLRSIIDA